MTCSVLNIDLMDLNLDRDFKGVHSQIVLLHHPYNAPQTDYSMPDPAYSIICHTSYI